MIESQNAVSYDKDHCGSASVSRAVGFQHNQHWLEDDCSGTGKKVRKTFGPLVELENLFPIED